MRNPVLSVQAIETNYGLVRALHGVSLDVAEGGIVAILGANGAGKTTVLKTIAGLMDPERGRVVFRGEEIQRRTPDAVARLGVSLVPEGRQVFPLLTVRDNLLMGAYARRDYAAIAADMEQVFSLFPRLLERADQRAGRLSGGEQQMLAISRALMARPRLLMLDEPSLGLSPKLIQDIYVIIRRINRERGTTILVVEQNARAALSVADFGYVLEVGRVVLSGAGPALLENRDIREFYLGVKEDAVRGERRWRRQKQWRS
jgi:branched-chain amino acid transport system ATP-binding protein